MSYQPISVKEAMQRINALSNGWFLPAVQRPYVWGSRYEGELYICKLFDSLLKGYPIGGIILWNTEDEIPYREFMKDFNEEGNTRIVDKGKWGKKDKWLVYDGQQRLQTLYSCLVYSFNNKILVFDLLYNSEDEENGEVGFKFIEKNENISPNFVRMNSLFQKNVDQKFDFEEEIIKKNRNLDETKNKLLRKNLSELWKVFVETDKKSLSYFPISHKNESKVNEIFQRLNMGGVPLSQADLLLSRIKESHFDFEENLQTFSKAIYNNTGNGYFFDEYSILQLMHLIVKGTIRVDPKKIKEKKDLEKFYTTWQELGYALRSFFVDFLWGTFKINHSSIVPKKLAILPIITYLYELNSKGYQFKDIPNKSLLRIKQYFILSQINDWNTLGIVDEVSRLVKESSKNSSKLFEFPLEKVKSQLESTKKRNTTLFENNFVDYTWFSLKILTPNKVYFFDPDLKGRFNPEIDHIFPKGLTGQDSSYKEKVDILWNLQPIKGEINNYKLKRNPKEFFSSEDGKKYFDYYDFLPSKVLTDRIWERPLEFISKRRDLMVEFLKTQYELDLTN